MDEMLEWYPKKRPPLKGWKKLGFSVGIAICVVVMSYFMYRGFFDNVLDSLSVKIK